jgi:hypothetical protein
MTVFVVQIIALSEYPDPVPVRVFSTREKAEEWIETLGENFSYELTECLIDKGGEL